MDHVVDEDLEDEDDGGRSTCKFCGSQDDDCQHLLGSRDLNFCGDFEVDGEGGPLNELSELFGELGEAVTIFLETRKKSGIGARKSDVGVQPQRLRNLLQAVADGNNNVGFTSYIEQVAKDTKVLVEAESHEEGGAPGFCSIVRMYWAKDVSAALAGIKLLVNEDIRHLRRPA